MFNNPHFDQVRQNFADQFEQDGAGFLYRKSMKGAPIRVTDTERDSFVASFNRRLRYAAWSVLPATVLVIGLLAFLVPDVESATGKLAMGFAIGLILGPFLLFYYWAWNAPARELERRPVAGVARTREEMRRIKFAKLTYGQLAFVPVIAAVLLLKVSADNDVFHGWGILWLVLAGALVALAAIQAIRKWNYERN